MKNVKHIAESKPDAFIEKSIGVALPGYEWVQALGLLMHCLNTEELAAEIFEDQDAYNEMVLVVKKIQKQVMGIQEKIIAAESTGLIVEEAAHKKIILM